MKKILIIQTAFIGDVILATSLVETVHATYDQNCVIDIVVRQGNEGLLEHHPFLNRVYVWKKKEKKYRNLLALSKEIRQEEYDFVFNLQRFASTGFLTWRSKAKCTVGFANNPLSFLFKHKVVHAIGEGRHEVERNLDLLKTALKRDDIPLCLPKLYPGSDEKAQIDTVVKEVNNFVVLAPASVWFTKQLPRAKWIELIQSFTENSTVFLIGAPSDSELIEGIIAESGSEKCKNMAGKLSLLASAELIGRAKRTYVNDSAPLHLASAMNAPVTAFFCSTVPAFGFGPLSADTEIKEVTQNLPCRPCGLHGFKACPKGHFKCGNLIDLG